MEPSKRRHSLDEHGGMRNYSIVCKPVFSQGCTVNTCLSSAPLWTLLVWGLKSGLHLICETSSFRG